MITLEDYQTLLDGHPSLQQYKGLDTRENAILGKHASFDLMEKEISLIEISKSHLSGRISDSTLTSCTLDDIKFRGFFLGSRIY